MISIDDKLISEEIFEKKFVCDLNACKGSCCIEGDAGAPLEMEEVSILEDIYDEVKPYMRPDGIAEVEKSGVFYMDIDNEPVTALVNGKECAFVHFDEQGITKCAIETAWRDGKINFRKPISCHLYPIRTIKLSQGEGINYHKWPICAPACDCGEKLDVKVYRFLKEPIERKWGAEFFKALEAADQHLMQR